MSKVKSTLKTCSMCKVEKTLSDFHKKKLGKYGRESRCRTCRSKMASDKYKRDTLDGYAVYYIPEHHYIGMTNNLVARMKHHRKAGKFTKEYEIVGIYKTPIEAHLIETQFHFMGYSGFNYTLHND